MKPKDKGVCGNKECDRPIDRTFQRLNQTQTNYCSIYCNRYVKEGLNPINIFALTSAAMVVEKNYLNEEVDYLWPS